MASCSCACEISQSTRSRLRLKLEPQFQDITPLDLVNRFSKRIAFKSPKSSGKTKLYRQVQMLEERRTALVNGFKEALSCISFLDSGYEEINSKSVSWVLQRFEAINKIWKMNKVLQEMENKEPKWCTRFEGAAEKLCSYLYDIKRKEEKGETVTRLMYQTMFDTFASMFGFYGGFGAPDGMPMRTIKVFNKEVCRTPDIVFKTREEDGEDSKTVLVVEVKLDTVDEPEHSDCGPSVRKRLKTCCKETAVSSTLSPRMEYNGSSAKESEQYFRLKEEVICQHCAELAAHYEDSLLENAVLGTIVEKTKVIFTALSASPNQIRDMLSDSPSLKENSRPVFIYTKAYDYLKQEDRNYLIDAFVKLSLIQMAKEPF